jgi:hypothetical protein
MMELKLCVIKRQRQFVLYGILMLILLGVSLAFAGDKKTSSSYEEELLVHINRYRLESGLNELSFDKTLNKLATTHCQQMEVTDKLSHSGFDERFEKCGRSVCVENVGWNFETAAGQFRAWKKSRGHNENMLNKQIRHAGISKRGPYVTFFACDWAGKQWLLGMVEDNQDVLIEIIKSKKKRGSVIAGTPFFVYGTEGRTWTGTRLPARDFKSLASTNSATSASLILANFLLFGQTLWTQDFSAEYIRTEDIRCRSWHDQNNAARIGLNTAMQV